MRIFEGPAAREGGRAGIGGRCGAGGSGLARTGEIAMLAGREWAEWKMSKWQGLERVLMEELRLGHRPVAVAFLDAVPEGIERVAGTQPSGCSFWRLAEEGRVFYTLAADHFNCAVGAYTHNIPLAPEREKETEQTLKMMFEAGYIRPEEVAGIAVLKKTPAATVYAPLGAAPVEPAVVLLRCRPGAAMLLNEAAMRAGSGAGLPPLGRPTCMAVPAAMEKGTVISFGCIGNRVYTGLGEEEMYVAVPGKDLETVAGALGIVAAANKVMEQYARQRRAQLATA